MYLISTGEMCKLFDVSRQGLHKWVISGRMPHPTTVGSGGQRPRYIWDIEKVAKHCKIDLAHLINSHKKQVSICAPVMKT